jgi:hypothetical protein
MQKTCLWFLVCVCASAHALTIIHIYLNETSLLEIKHEGHMTSTVTSAGWTRAVYVLAHQHNPLCAVMNVQVFPSSRNKAVMDRINKDTLDMIDEWWMLRGQCDSANNINKTQWCELGTLNSACFTTSGTEAEQAALRRGLGGSAPKPPSNT